ncbi:NAD(P)/FAD-dependent oxidoreductase [Nitrincola alkalilacustris]|uniref:NAD(P)/FAD-dependent oxidoreductase n=1 Tax=Nitrincola alkalilacustris TaxID=1571224 RepID=UPI00124BFE39|nr:FAD-dependent oxidoreductase [Nitrincola alkalilacustris]
MKHYDLIIIGNGMAGHRLLTELSQQASKPRSVLVIGEEPGVAYNRILLSPLLSGEMEEISAELSTEQWYAEQGFSLLTGEQVVSIEPRKKQVVTSAGQTIGYEKLVLATGSRPFLPPLEGRELDGVMSFRNWKDMQQLRSIGLGGGQAIVIGGGFLGLEAAEGLRKLGMQVTVLQRADYLLNRQLDQVAAGLLQNELSARGMTVLTDVDIQSLQGDGKVERVLLKDGRLLPADLVVIATGIVPRTELAQEAGLQVRQGVCVNRRLRTSDAAIHALGECCECQGNTYGLVAPIWEQARVLASLLSGEDDSYTENPVATSLKISGISLYSCGDIDAADATEQVYMDSDLKDYRRLLIKDDRLVGAILYGDIGLGPWYFDLLKTQQAVGQWREQLMFGLSDESAASEAA